MGYCTTVLLGVCACVRAVYIASVTLRQIDVTSGREVLDIDTRAFPRQMELVPVSAGGVNKRRFYWAIDHRSVPDLSVHCGDAEFRH